MAGSTAASQSEAMFENWRPIAAAIWTEKLIVWLVKPIPVHNVMSLWQTPICVRTLHVSNKIQWRRLSTFDNEFILHQMYSFIPSSAYCVDIPCNISGISFSIVISKLIFMKRVIVYKQKIAIFWHIEVWWCIYAPGHCVLLGSHNDLSPVQRQTSDGSSIFDPWEQTSMKPSFCSGLNMLPCFQIPFISTRVVFVQ